MSTQSAVGYVRVSTLVQASEGESLSAQVSQIKQHASSRKLKIQETYSDTMSGASQERPALLKLLRDAEHNRFSFVIVRSLSRFGRNAGDLLKNVEKLKEHGVSLISITGRH